MKVWVVTENDYDTHEVLGVYTSKEEMESIIGKPNLETGPLGIRYYPLSVTEAETDKPLRRL